MSEEIQARVNWYVDEALTDTGHPIESGWVMGKAGEYEFDFVKMKQFLNVVRKKLETKENLTFSFNDAFATARLTEELRRAKIAIANITQVLGVA